MPRKLRVVKARRPSDLEVADCLYVYLLWKNYAWAREIAQVQQDDDGMAEVFFANDQQTRRYWDAIEAEALDEWVTAFPGTRPPLWWEYSAPEFRQLVGGTYHTIAGATRCWASGVPFIDNWQGDPPLVESPPGYLDRLNLWRPGERLRVPGSAFAPQLFSSTLTIAPTEPKGVTER